MSSTDSFDTTGMLSLQSNDNESFGIGEELTATSTHSPSVMTSLTATTLATPLPQNRFIVATNSPVLHHVSVPNEISATLYNTTSTPSSQFNSTSNMTSSYDSRNSSNTSFNVRFTTMKPCEWLAIKRKF